MEFEKRVGQSPIPSSPSFFLSEKQINGIDILNKFGWKLAFIRRPLFSEVIPVVENTHENSIGVLGVDGILQIRNDLKIRKEPLYY